MFRLLAVSVCVLVLCGCSPQKNPIYSNQETSIPGKTVLTGKATITGESSVTGTTTPIRSASMTGEEITQKVVSDTGLLFLNLPPGFTIHVYAEVPNARSLEVVETDDALVTFVGNRRESRVYALVDTDKDYQVDEIKEIADGLNSPNGVAYKDGNLYVAEVSRIIMFRDILKNLDTPSYETFFDDLPTDTSHGWKYIAFGPDGALYVPIGAPCNICDAGVPYAALHRLDVETQELQLVAEGIRNTVGFDRHPETEELRFTDNGRDRMGDDVPVDELNVLTQEGQHFGYPYCHQGDVLDPGFTDRSCDEFIPPQTKLGPHVAALGMLFSDTLDVPPSWQNHVFIAEHGSWNRSVATGYRIAAVDLAHNEYTTFIDGRLQGTEVLGRPVDVAALPDGSLLITDDHAGRVYRVQWHAE